MVSVILWTVAIIALLLGLMLGVYPVFMESKADILNVLEGFPPEFSAAFGINIKSMFSFGGFYAFCFSYLSLMGGIMAAALGIDSFSRESRMKCLEFIFTKPVSRSMIFVQKLLANLCLIIAMNTVFMVMVQFIGIKNNTNMFLPGLSLFFTQLVFLSLGMVYATFAKRVRSVSGMATTFGFVAFIMSALINILEEEALRFVTPLKYFDPTALFVNGSYEFQYAMTGVGIIVIGIAMAYMHFTTSDIKSV